MSQMTTTEAIQESRVPPSAVSESFSSVASPDHPPHLQHLAQTILHNLRYEHDWTSLTIYTHSPLTGSLLLRPVIAGIPPKRLYVHPDEQIAILKAEHASNIKIPQPPEPEWVLPTHISESWSLAKFAAIFDALSPVPDIQEKDEEHHEHQEQEGHDGVGAEWRGDKRQKRIVLATSHNDSTVVYYIVHDGLVKPRQN